MGDVYWDSAYRPDRDRLLDAVAGFWPFTSVLELGCNTGPVRRRLRERFGLDWEYVGVDVNEAALELARAFAREGGDGRAAFQWLDIRSGLLDQIGPARFDVVVSSSVLQAIPDPPWSAVLNDCRAIAVKGVVVLEDYGQGECLTGRGWAYSYPPWVVCA